MTPAHADVVGVAAATASANAAEPTPPTADHGAQQVGIGGIVPPGKLLIVRQLRLDQIKLFLADDRWNLRHGGPLLLACLKMSSSPSTDGNQGGVSSTRFHRAATSDVNGSCVDGIGENASDSRLIPSGFSCGTGNAPDRPPLGPPLSTFSFLQMY